MNKLDERLTRAGTELRDAAGRRPPLRVPVRQPWRSAFAFATGVAAVVLLVALPAWLLSGGGPDVRPVADTPGGGSVDVFMLPDYVPDGFELVRASLFNVDQTWSGDAGDAAGIVLKYGQNEAQGGDQERLTIVVSDRLAVMAAGLGQEDLRCFADDGTEIPCPDGARLSACVSDPAAAEGAMNPETCMDEIEQRPPESFGGTNVDFDRATVRGLPAHIIRVTGSDDFDMSVTTYEGGPVISEVTGSHIDEDVLIRIADELVPVDPARFEALIGWGGVEQ